MMKKISVLKKWGYYLTVFFIALTGFAQMPIFKRYYIADIPGLGWLADFYTTHRLHYIFSTFFIIIVFYTFARSILDNSWKIRICKPSNLLRVISVTGLVLTGFWMVYKNLKGVYLPHNLVTFLDVSHLGFCLLFLGGLPFQKQTPEVHIKGLDPVYYQRSGKWQ